MVSVWLYSFGMIAFWKVWGPNYLVQAVLISIGWLVCGVLRIVVSVFFVVGFFAFLFAIFRIRCCARCTVLLTMLSIEELVMNSVIKRHIKKILLGLMMKT